LTNVASGTTEQLKEVMNKGAVPAFVKILHSKNKDLREQVHISFDILKVTGLGSLGIWEYMRR